MFELDKQKKNAKTFFEFENEQNIGENDARNLPRYKRYRDKADFLSRGPSTKILKGVVFGKNLVVYTTFILIL